MFTEQEILVLSEALQDYAIKYVEKKTPEGKLTLGDEPQIAMEIMAKINERSQQK